MTSPETTIAMTFRVGKARAKALRQAAQALPYRTSQSALIDRAIDLLIADMKAKGEVK